MSEILTIDGEITLNEFNMWLTGFMERNGNETLSSKDCARISEMLDRVKSDSVVCPFTQHPPYGEQQWITNNTGKLDATSPSFTGTITKLKITDEVLTEDVLKQQTLSTNYKQINLHG